MINRFISGDFGLAKTCWFGLLTLVGGSVTTSFVGHAGRKWDADIHSAFELDNVYFALLFVISVSIWRAAGKYDGPPAWALLAKATVVVYWVSHIAIQVYIHLIL